MSATEFNFDGLVGPTHNYAGLSHGNVASVRHQHSVSSPKSAALQGLEKMKFVRDLGIEQCVLPPLPRPNLKFLRKIGFTGSDVQLVEKAYRADPVLLAVCYSASNMWTANAATVSPSSDCDDGRLHLTPANLSSNLHRSLEAAATTEILRSIFCDSGMFHVHDPLPANTALSDEGAANHTRLGPQWDEPGIELFVYGTEFLKSTPEKPEKFPARQTLESSRAIARRHLLDPGFCLFLQQNPLAIDAGVFHNDVIAVGHQNVLVCHELAFLAQQKSIDRLQDTYRERFQSELHIIEFSNKQLPIDEAVSSYLFNSQIVTRSDGRMAMICPADCQSIPNANRCAEQIVEADNPIDELFFMNLRQSMNNGGGPACLRLRVVLDDQQQRRFHKNVRLTDELYDKLVAWVVRHYRDELAPDDLRDPELLSESRDAAEALSRILAIPITN